MHDRFSAFINPIMSNCSFLVKVTEAVRKLSGMSVGVGRNGSIKSSPALASCLSLVWNYIRELVNTNKRY